MNDSSHMQIRGRLPSIAASLHRPATNSAIITVYNNEMSFEIGYLITCFRTNMVFERCQLVYRESKSIQHVVQGFACESAG